MTTDEAELRREIEKTREQLGETVAELTAKMDVKERTKAELAKAKGNTRLQLIVAGTAVAAFAASLVVRGVRS
jgi:ABC-type enterochelin transport system substrate-binding protein